MAKKKNYLKFKQAPISSSTFLHSQRHEYIEVIGPKECAVNSSKL